MANGCFLDFRKKWRRQRYFFSKCSTALTTLAIGIRKQNRARAWALLPVGPTISPLAGALARPWPGQSAFCHATPRHHAGDSSSEGLFPAGRVDQVSLSWEKGIFFQTYMSHTITPEDHTMTVSPFYSWAQKWPSVIEWKRHLGRIGNQWSNSGTYLRLTDNSEPQQMPKCLIN